MLVSEKLLTWAMRFYPPFLFQGIWTRKFSSGFTGSEIKIYRCLFNLNYNRTIFGGTIFSAADPFYVICLHQILSRKGYTVKLWTRKVTIDYVKPGTSSLYIKISIRQELIDECLQSLDTAGKFLKTFPVKITNKEGAVVAIVHNEVYIKCIKTPSKQ